VTPAHLFTPKNIEFDGGKRNVFDPENEYQKAYLKLWGLAAQ
jgi:ribose transport system substrate-binding protein